MKQSGYYRFPSIHNENIAFVSEDDLWSVSANGGPAVRLTSNLAIAARPYFSPDGKWLAFTGSEEGNPEVYVMPAQGGVAKRLTFNGAMSLTIGWSQDGHSILFISNGRQPFPRLFEVYQVSHKNGIVERLNYGMAQNISFGQKGVVLGRNTLDSARWKRYKGGTKGVLWIDEKGEGQFKKLDQLEGNISTPMWIGDRIYFLSDHDGIGSLSSCTPKGKGMITHYQDAEFYARNAQTDGISIVFQMGAEIMTYDIASEKTNKIDIEWNSPRVQLNRKFTSAAKYLEHYALHPDGHSTLISSRGKVFSFGNWEGPVQQLKTQEIGRYRLPTWLSDKKHIVVISDKDGKEVLEKHNMKWNGKITKYDKLGLGRVLQLEVSPHEDKVAISNHRYELILVDLKKKTSHIIDKSKYNRITGFSWAPDGNWLTYSCSDTQESRSIKLFNLKTKKKHSITSKRFTDVLPTFDPSGKFIYFISYRIYDPVYDSHYFDLNFPKGSCLYLVALQDSTESPFILQPKPLQEEKGKNGSKENNENQKDAFEEVVIDLKGIENRVVAFPIPESNYYDVVGLKNKVLYFTWPKEGALGQDTFSTDSPKRGTLHLYDFEKGKAEVVATGVTSFDISLNETIIYRSGNRLRVLLAGAKDNKKQQSTETNRETGWLNLSRVKLSIDPSNEWRQMYGEIWRLQQEQFWSADMSGVDWKRVYDRYYPLLDKVASRSEFSDIAWEMQGELGTSHAYEMGGDYKEGPHYTVGFLGADLKYDSTIKKYVVDHIVQGDSWIEKSDSPLNRLGVNLKKGDIILAINGERLSKKVFPQECLVHMANTEIMLTVQKQGEAAPSEVMVKTMMSETKARYREWVEHNRKKVERLTKGKIGYLHIPDMGPWGYSEFHRYYRTEVEKDALIVDVRYNGGGHVSQLILEKLVRKRIGNRISRWDESYTYPDDVVEGPMVALTNEHAGSDGDIFSHCFKLMKLGPLIGTRTWGGVVGISPRHALVDRTLTTQPEFSTWFDDVKWGVENYGTDPDIEVDIKPQDWKAGIDPQLDKGIEVILKALKKNPVKKIKFGKRPQLKLPK